MEARHGGMHAIYYRNRRLSRMHRRSRNQFICKPENFIDDKLHMKVANFMEKDQLENLRLEFSFEC